MTDHRAVKLIKNGNEYCFGAGGDGSHKFYYVVAGGGGGGYGVNCTTASYRPGGGGGGGDVCYGWYCTLSNSVNVVVGSGGAGCSYYAAGTVAGNGGYSSIGNIVARGGYGAGYAYCNLGGVGWSGSLCKNGGTISNYNPQYAGGGANGDASSGSSPGPGICGHGRGGPYAGQNASCCGNGGGGGFSGSSGNVSGTGGKNGFAGIAKICYHTDGSDGINNATGGTVTTSGVWTVHTFTSNGTFCILS